MIENVSLPGVPGFQGSETSGAEVTFYPQTGDPIVLQKESLSTTGRRRSDSEPCLISVNTQKQLGVASGQWSLTVKQPKGISESLFDLILDDDWVDITFYRHGRKWHTIRGLVDDMRRPKAVGGSGATVETFNIVGRCFGKIWEDTPVFFSVYTDDVVAGGIAYKVFSGAPNLLGHPDIAVEGYLFGFLKQIAGYGRSNWELPAGMPNVDGAFSDNVFYDITGFPPDGPQPQRKAINPNFMNPQGTLWQLAQEWSDPMFLELYTDTLPLAWEEMKQGDTWDTGQTKMVVVLRDRPFPTVSDGNEAYLALPMIEVPRQMVTSHEVGRSGRERFNAFFISNQHTQTLLGMGAFDLVKPLWNQEDMKRHGMRRFDVTTKYLPDDTDLPGMCEIQRQTVRDWYCLNPYMLSGTVNFGLGLPNLKIGMRLRIKDDDEKLDETYYVESVGTNWTFGPGLRTTAGVTRGWVGTDDSYMDALWKMVSKYESPAQAAPETFAVA